MRDFRKISKRERRKIAGQLRLDSCRMIAGERIHGGTVIRNRIWLYLISIIIICLGTYFLFF